MADRYTPREIEKLLHGLGLGLSFDEIGAKLNRSPYALATKVLYLYEEQLFIRCPEHYFIDTRIARDAKREIRKYESKGDVKAQKERYRLNHQSAIQ